MLAPSSFRIVSRRKPRPSASPPDFARLPQKVRMHFCSHHAGAGKVRQETNLDANRKNDMSGIWIMFTFWARR